MLIGAGCTVIRNNQVLFDSIHDSDRHSSSNNSCPILLAHIHFYIPHSPVDNLIYMMIL